MDNFNESLGLPYGVISANNVPYLLDDILSNGTDLNYESARSELIDRLESAIKEVMDDSCWRIDDAKNAAEEIIDNADCEWESDSDNWNYEYEDSDGKYLLGSLGGAGIIWIVESEYVMPCRQCSPCVPGAGDLDSYDPYGSFALCLDPETLNADDRDDEFQWYDSGEVYKAANGSKLKIVHYGTIKDPNYDPSDDSDDIILPADPSSVSLETPK